MLKLVTKKIIHKNLSKRKYSVRNKIVTLEEAVAVVQSENTLCVSGFVAQGCPEGLCSALGDRFTKTGSPKNLTLLFGGGPGDWNVLGLNHFAKEGMLKRTIGGHYGQAPQIAKMVLDNKVGGYNLPMGSISRMIRATASKVPGHFTTIGFGTFVDPRITGGKINALATEDLIEVVNIGGKDYLWYKAIPIHVAFIRATTADPEGNLTLEHESLLNDVKIIAMAARNSGGTVVAQVKRIAERNSLHARKVHVPGILVDCVYKEEDPEKHKMSFFMDYDPSWASEIKVTLESIKPLPLDNRKVISRRASFELVQDQIVNLGIGMPEGIASVANEEKVLKFITLTTEPGVIGGLGASGHNFGPAANADSLMEMNQQFDFYNGGGLDISYLGLAQVNQNGDVNVSRLSKTHLTGPGGFIDISQSTMKVCFMGTFTTKGLETAIENGKLIIKKEGTLKKFVKDVNEITFSGLEATKRGQSILYVTERCVFKRVSNGIELIEVAPGIDVERDILNQMEFKPIVKNPKPMDLSIFGEDLMGLKEKMFGLRIENRLNYNSETNSVFVDFSGLTVVSKEDVEEIKNVLTRLFDEYMEISKGQKISVIVNYDGFDCREEVVDLYSSTIQQLQDKYYKSVKRYTGKAFNRFQLAHTLKIADNYAIWSMLCSDPNGKLNKEELRQGLQEKLSVRPTEEFLDSVMERGTKGHIDRSIVKYLVSNLGGCTVFSQKSP